MDDESAPSSPPEQPELQDGFTIAWPLTASGQLYNRESLKRVAAANSNPAGSYTKRGISRPLAGHATKWMKSLDDSALEQPNGTSELQVLRSLMRKACGSDGIKYGSSPPVHQPRVWVCQVVSNPDQLVVLKLFTDVEYRDFIGAEGAKREAAAFERLETLQGGALPYSYGFYKFSHASWQGVSLIGHVMEYVEGEGADDLSTDSWFNEDLTTMILLQKSIFETIIHFHQLGVFHGDLASRNIIATRVSEQNDEATSIFPVFIDWEDSIVVTRADVDLLKAGSFDIHNPVGFGARRDSRGVTMICIDDGFGCLSREWMKTEQQDPQLETLRMRAAMPLSKEVMELDTICSLDWKLSVGSD